MARSRSTKRAGAKATEESTKIDSTLESKHLKDELVKNDAAAFRSKLVGGYSELPFILDAILTMVIMAISPLMIFWAFIHDKLMFKFLNRAYIYNVSWEDPRMDHRIFNLSEKDHIITIASAGCNVLDYIIEGSTVTAVDFNSCQIALTELKQAAILNITYEDFFDIFSNSNMELLRELYPKKLRPSLTPDSAEFWDDGIYSIKSFMYSGTSGVMSWVLFRLIFPLFGLGFVRDELIKGTSTKEELCQMIADRSYTIRSLAWLLDNIMLRGGCCFAGVPERQMSLGMHRSNNMALVIERVFFKSDLINDNYFYSGYILGRYAKHNCPRYLREENYEIMRKYLKAGKLTLHTGTILEAINKTKKPITVASLLDHMDWMTDRMIQEELTHLIKKMDQKTGKIYWRTFADDVHSAPLRWLDPIRVGHADDEYSDDRVGMYWTTWIAHLKDVKVVYEERIDVNQSKGWYQDIATGFKIVTFPFWRPFISTLEQQGHAKDMEAFYKYQKDGYDAFREKLLHARPILMENFPLRKSGDMVWIDVGGGTARNLEYLNVSTIRKFFKKIYIVDISTSLLEVASKRIQLMGISDIVEVIECDFTSNDVFKHLPKLGTVDAVTMSYSFSMIPDQDKCVQNITSLLKAGTGWMAIADFFIKGNHDDCLPATSRFMRKIESQFHKNWFKMDSVHLLHDEALVFKNMESTWDNRFRGGVPFIPFLQPYHGVKFFRKLK
jgi:betaine lipid synthase